VTSPDTHPSLSSYPGEAMPKYTESELLALLDSDVPSTADQQKQKKEKHTVNSFEIGDEDSDKLEQTALQGVLTAYTMIGRKGGVIEPTPILSIMENPSRYGIEEHNQWVDMKDGCPFSEGRPHSSKSATVSFTVSEDGTFRMICRDPSHGHPKERMKTDSNGKTYWSYLLSSNLVKSRSKFPPFKTGSHTEIANVLLGSVFYGAEFDSHTTLRMYKEHVSNPKRRHAKTSPEIGKWVPVGEHTVKQVITTLDGEWVVTGTDKAGNDKYRRLVMNDGTVQGVFCRIIGALEANRAAKRKDGTGAAVSAFQASPIPCISLIGSIYDLHSGRVILPDHHESRDYYCRSEHTLPCEFWSNDCPAPTRFLELLNRCWGHQPDYQNRVDFFQEWVGVALAGEATKHETHVLLKGEAMSGKSRVINVVAALFPRESVVSVPPHDLDGFKMTGFVSARLNAVAEVPEKGLANATMMKALQSGDAVQIDRKFKDPLVVRSQAAWLFGCNSSWRPSESHNSVFRRWRVLSFDRPVSESERDPAVAEKIIENEIQSIVKWAVDGYRRFKANKEKFTNFVSSEESIMEWRRDIEPLRVWIQDYVEINPPEGVSRVSVAEHYASYRKWSMDSGFSPVSLTKFGIEVQALGIEKIKGRSANYHNVRIKHGMREFSVTEGVEV
jgi:hypothetical protein